MEIIFSNYSKGNIDKSLIRKIARRSSRKKWTVNMSFVSKSKIRELNRKYRKKNMPTDVLSFYMGEDGILGDVIICSEVAKENAKRFGSGYKAEIARLAAHGILHLLGFRHGKKMFDFQDKITGGINYA